ncbi:MAG: sensor histidine kinase [Longimicrobiales bacterium]
MAGLLVLTLGLVGVLAYQAVDATRSHQRMAERTLKEHALFAAWELSSAVRRELFIQVLAPGFEVVAKAGGVYQEVPLKTPGSVGKIAEEFGWWPAMDGLDYVFRYSLDSGDFQSSGEVVPGGATKEWLVGLIKAQADPGPEAMKKLHWSMAFHGSGDQERIVAYASQSGGETGDRMGFGFQFKPKVLLMILQKIEESAPLLPPALTGGESGRKLLSFSIDSRTHRSLYRSTPQYKSPDTASDTLGEVYGGLSAVVSLRPEAAESLVIGGLPKSRLPTILGLLALASGLVIAALFQIRREQELSLLRTDFVSSVSHQLRTPLAQIRMFGETLLLGRVRSEEERKRSLEIIVKESQRLTHQVDNVLLFSRAQRQDVQLSPQDLLLAPLIREKLESFCPLAEAQDCRVEASLDESLSARADPGAVKQILLNLLENAVKYGPRDQIVDVKLRRGRPGKVRLEVEDEGEGIPVDQQEAVFSPYARLDRHRDSGVAGSGIGLAVVRELVERQGGSVWVEEAMSGGARLTVELPEANGGPAGARETAEIPGSSFGENPIPGTPGD